MQAMFGAVPIHGGEIRAHGSRASGSIHAFMRRGIGMPPTNRKREFGGP